jgi:hypothetical protein
MNKKKEELEVKKVEQEQTALTLQKYYRGYLARKKVFESKMKDVEKNGRKNAKEKYFQDSEDMG